jgi:glycosyltransferase involved in cell wall biosynthesis
MADLSILIPAHNEEGNLPQLIGEIEKAMPQGMAYEIVIVDDGSTDKTRSELLECMQTNVRLSVFAHGQRAGKSAALKTGFDRCKGRWIALLDGDGQNDPADLARIWPEISSGPDKVIYAGVRKSRNDGLVKKYTSRVANAIRRRALRDTSKDSGCGFKVLPADLARAFPYFDNMHRFFPALARRHGYDVREVSINDRPRVHGTSKYGFFDRAAVALLDLTGVYWLIRRYSPRGEIEELSPSRTDDLATSNIHELRA